MIGINIGDVYTEGDPIPCVSFEGRMEGTSRTVVIVTVRYRSTPGGQPSSGGGSGVTVGRGAGSARELDHRQITDPRTQSPELRPPLYTMSSSLQQAANPMGRRHKDNGALENPRHPTNAAKMTVL